MEPIPTNAKAAVLFISGQSNAHGQFQPEVQKWFANGFTGLCTGVTALSNTQEVYLYA